MDKEQNYITFIKIQASLIKGKEDAERAVEALKGKLSQLKHYVSVVSALLVVSAFINYLYFTHHI